MCRQSNVAGYEYKYLLLIKFSSSPDVGCRPYKMLRCQKPLSPSWLNSSVSLKKTVESIISQLNVSHLSSLVDRLVQKKGDYIAGFKKTDEGKERKSRWHPLCCEEVQLELPTSHCFVHCGGSCVLTRQTSVSSALRCCWYHGAESHCENRDCLHVGVQNVLRD